MNYGKHELKPDVHLNVAYSDSGRRILGGVERAWRSMLQHQHRLIRRRQRQVRVRIAAPRHLHSPAPVTEQADIP